MVFHPGIAAADSASGAGDVDYRLQRRALLADLEAGRVARHEVCDAHPELVRVANNCDTIDGGSCPVCDRGEMALVHYVFGPRLAAGGKLALTEADLDRYGRRSGDFAAYRVEVCAGCGWNHLLCRIILGT
ncbi:MAG: DUF5318 domain-containing protein [Actinomycetia bacterium]|nr:DUF5318 domain-containing protein [Actinomycetes bacterium]MCP4962840.1 DUF5318 domain-containing protein [Actinomycetes bacterium]